jgi:cell division protein FtsQ
MDGAGRLDRSLRSLRPQADLKAAAIGAVVLLREWLGSKLAPARSKLAPARSKLSLAPSKRVPAEFKQRLDRAEEAPRLITLVERYLPRRAGMAATVLLLLGSASFGVVRGGHLEAFTTALSDSRNAIANSAGFRITTVAINGRRQLSQDEVLGIGGVNGRSSLLFLDAAVVRDKLKANPWISDATVLKLYPGQLRIDIVERSAFALWQQGGRLSVIADDGAVLEPYVSRRFLSLPLVVGKGAETRARDFLALLARYPQVNAVTRAAIFVGERRWNLRLKDGLDIRLPENEVGNALAALSTLDKEDRLFSRDIVAVDMRLPDRLSVQLSDDAAKAREDLFKDKKLKKKAGDA